MKKLTGRILFFTLLLPQFAGAYYTNENFSTIVHSQPSWFLSDSNGGFYGATEDGTAFTQKPVTNNIGVRLHKFQIDAAYFYISDQGIINAQSDLVALSMYLALV